MRTQRPRGSITREAVVNAALDVVDRAGVEALTIRGVARELGAPPMSLYSHFENKSQLLDLMYGEVVRRLYPDQGNSRWQAELLVLCQHIRGLLVVHPEWTPLLARPIAPLSVPVRERLLTLMTADGMAAQHAFSAIAGACLAATGLALVELALRNSAGTSDIDARYSRLKDWSATSEEAPVMRQAMAENPKFDLSAVHAFQLKALIRGLELELDRPAPPP